MKQEHVQSSKTLIRRITATVLAVLLLATSINLDAVTVSAASNGGDCGKDGSNVTWSYDSDATTLTISGSGEMADYKPSTVPWSGIKEYVTTVVVEAGVTSVGDSTFARCLNLTSVTLPESVESIGENAFSGCYALKNITIPDGVEFIGINAFYGCSGLTAVTIPENVVFIGEYAFQYCSALTDITIPGSVLQIGKAAFSNCSKLKKATLNAGVRSIESSAFSGCSQLSSLTMGEGVRNIGNDAFKGCPVKNVTMPTTVTSIGSDVFDDWNQITNIETVLPNLTKMPAVLLTKYGTETKTDPNVSIKVIGALNGDETVRIGELLETVVDGYTGGGHLFYRYSGEATSTYGSAVYQYMDLDLSSENEDDDKGIKDSALEYAGLSYASTTKALKDRSLTVTVYASDSTGTYILGTKTVTLEQPDLKSEMTDLSAVMIEGETTGLAALIGRSGITHITGCIKLSSSNRVSEGRDKLAIDTSNNVTAKQAGTATIAYSGSTSNCQYHGADATNGVSMQVTVVPAPVITASRTSLMVTNPQDGFAYYIDGIKGVLSDGKVLFEGLDPATTYSVSMRSVNRGGGQVSFEATTRSARPFIQITGNTQFAYGESGSSTCEILYDGFVEEPTFTTDDIVWKTENHDGVTVTVEDGKVMIATAENTPEGSYSFVIRKANGTSAVTSDVITVEVKKKSITPEIQIEDWTYGDTPSEPSVEGNSGNADVTYNYKLASRSDSAYSADVPTNAGAYVVRAEIAESEWYSGATVTKDFTINKKEVTVTWTDTELPYNGTFQQPKGTVEGLIGEDTCDVWVAGARNVGTYPLGISLTGANAGNYKLKQGEETVSFTITNGTQEAPQITANAETVSGKKDGKIDGLTTDMEYRIKPEDPEATEEEYPYTKITDADMTFVPGTYEVRCAAKSNYDPSPAVEVTIAAGEKMKVILPEKQEGYTITSDVSEISYGESIHLTFKMDEGYSRTEDFNIKVNGQILTPDEDGTYTVENIQSAPEITVEGVKDLTAPTGSLTVAGTKWDELVDPDAITFQKFLKDRQQVTIEAEDIGSGIDSVEYYLSEERLTQSQLEDIADEDWTQYKKPFDVNPGTKQIIYVRIKDNAGNVTYRSTDGMIIYADPVQKTEKLEYTRTGTEAVGAAVKTNGNKVSQIVNGSDVLAEGTDYTVSSDGETITFTAEYLQSLKASDQPYQITVSYEPFGKEYMTDENRVTVADTTMELIVKKAHGTIRNISDSTKEYDGKPVAAPEFTTGNTRGDKDTNVTVEYKKKNAPDDTYTTEAPVNAGDYVMRITVESDGDYTKAVEEKEFSIRGIAMDVKVSGYQGVYDGKEHGLSITVTAPAKGYTISYGTEEGDCNKTALTYKDAGTYTVYYKVTADNYHTETGSAVIEIAGKELSGITWGSTEFTYDGKNHVPEATAEGLLGSDVCNVTVTGGQKHAGNGYTATAASLDNKNYILPEKEITTTFTITKRALTIRPDAAIKHIGTKDPEFTWTADQLVKGDELKGLTIERETGEEAGTYQIVVKADAKADPDYEITCKTAEFTITDHVQTVTKEAVAATCTQPGAAEEISCQICDKVLQEQTEIPALGHDWSGDWTVTTDAAGNQKQVKTCLRENCGQKMINFIPAKEETDPDAGKVKQDIEITKDAPADDVVITNTKSEILAADGIFSEEEKEKIKAGSSARVWMQVSDMDETTIGEENRAQMEDAAQKELGTNAVITYFDAELFKQIDEEDAVKIHEPGIVMQICMQLPETLLSDDDSIVRDYKIIRQHTDEETGDVQTDVLQTSFDRQTGVLTFETDRFSTYAIVYAGTQMAKDVTISAPAGGTTLTKTGETMQLTATVSPENTADKTLIWTSSDPSVATVDENGCVTAVGNGTAVITATTKDGSKTATCTITVVIPDNTDNGGNTGNGNDNSGKNPADSQTTVSAAEAEVNALKLNAGLKVSQNGSNIDVSWGSVPGVDGYNVYVQYCGKSFAEKSVTKVNGSASKKVTIRKVNGKKLDLKKNYKVYVEAYKLKDGNQVILGKTIMAHIVGRKNTTYTNVKGITVTKSSYQLKKGKTAAIKAKTVLVNKHKKPLSNAHAKELRYATSDKRVATVSGTGKIKATGKGSCTVYVYARNGYAKKIKVKVK